MMTYTPLPPRATTASQASIAIEPRTVLTQHEWTPAGYSGLLGWATKQYHDRTFLVLHHGMAAVVVPPALASGAVELLQRDDVCGPVLSVSGDQPSWVFLADPNGLVVTREDLPVGVGVLSRPAQVPIPVVGSSSGHLRWCVSPTPSRRWLPTLDTVLCVVDWLIPQPASVSSSRSYAHSAELRRLR